MDHLRSYMSIITYPSEYIQEQILKHGSGIFLFILNYGQPLRKKAFNISGILSKKDASQLSEYFKTYLNIGQ